MVSLPIPLSTRLAVSSTPISRPLGIWPGRYICHAPTRPVVPGVGEAVRKGCKGWLAATGVRVADCTGTGDAAAVRSREAVSVAGVADAATPGFVVPFAATAGVAVGTGIGSDPTRFDCDLL